MEVSSVSASVNVSSTAQVSFASMHPCKPLPLLEDVPEEEPPAIGPSNTREARLTLLPTSENVTASSAVVSGLPGSPSGTKSVLPGTKGPYSVYVSNLPPRATEKALNSVLGGCGEVTRIALHRRKGRTDVSYAFIGFSTLDGATSAVKLRDVYLHGKKLTIQFAYSTTTNSGNGSSTAGGQRSSRVQLDPTQHWKKNEVRVKDALKTYLDSLSDGAEHGRVVEALRSAARRMPRPIHTTSDHGPISLSGPAPIIIRSLSQVRSERQGGTLCAGEDEESNREQFDEGFDSQGGGESDNVCVADWDEDEETKGEGEEAGEEEEKVEEEKEKKGKEVGAEKETSEENEDVIGEAGMQMISNGLDIIPGNESAMSVTTPQTVLHAPAHSDGESSCGVPLLDSPTLSSSPLSEGGKHSLASRCCSARFPTPTQEGSPSTAELSGTKKSPMARYQAMAAVILGSASDKSTVSEAKHTGTQDQIPQSSGSMEGREGITEKVDEVQRCSKKKKAKKAVKLAAQFGNPRPQISSTGPLPVCGPPLPASLNSDRAPKESISKELSPSSTISSQESRMLQATKPHVSSSPPNGYAQTAEAGTVVSASDDRESEAVGSASDDNEGGAVGSTDDNREGGAVRSTGDDREGGAVRSTDNEGGAVESTDNEGGAVESTDNEGGAVESTGDDREGGAVTSTGNDREGGAVTSTGNDREGGAVGSTGNDREGGAVGSTGGDTEGEADGGSSRKQLAKWQDQITALKASLSETVSFNECLLQTSRRQDNADPSIERLCEGTDDTCQLQLSTLHKRSEVDERSNEWQKLLRLWSTTPNLDYNAMEEEVQLLQELEVTEGILEVERLRQVLLQQAMN